MSEQRSGSAPASVQLSRPSIAICRQIGLAAFASILFVSAASAGPQNYKPAALWEWNENVITDSRAQAALFKFAASHGVARIYIECEGAIQHNQAGLKSFLLAAATQGLTTELLFGDDKWVFPGRGYPHQGYAVSLTARYAAQLLSQMTYGLPVAVHYDVEPADLRQWKTHTNTIANDYIGLVTRLARAAHKLGLGLSADVTYWYGGVTVRRHGVATPFNQLIIGVVDRYVIMDYWDTARRIERQAATDLAYANTIPGKQVVIGVLTNCREKPPDISFCNDGKHSGTKYMESVLRRVDGVESPNASFSGFAIEDYVGFRKLGP